MRGYVTRRRYASLSLVTTNSRYNIPNRIEGAIVVKGIRMREDGLEDVHERVCY